MAHILNKDKILAIATRFLDEGRVDKAIVEYQKMCAADPADLRMKLKLAELYVRNKQVNEAIQTYLDIAKIYTADTFYLKAVTVYKKILRLNPAMIDINSELAKLYEQMGLIKDAISQYHILIRLYEQAGDLDKLQESRKRIVELDPNNIQSRIRLAETYQIQGKNEESIAEYEELVGELEKREKTPQLVDMYKKILAKKGGSDDVLRKLARIYYADGKFKETVDLLSPHSSIVDQDPELVKIQGESYSHLNQIESAKGRYWLLTTLCQSRGDQPGLREACKALFMLAPDEEDEIRPLADGIEPNGFMRLKEEVLHLTQPAVPPHAADEAKKGILSESSESSIAQNEREDSVRGEKVGMVSANTMAEELKKGNACFELGLAYLDMGLPEESKEELAKALAIFRKVHQHGIQREDLIEKIKEIEYLHPDIAGTWPEQDLLVGMEKKEKEKGAMVVAEEVEKEHDAGDLSADPEKIVRMPKREGKYAKLVSEKEKEKEVKREKKRRISFV